MWGLPQYLLEFSLATSQATATGHLPGQLFPKMLSQYSHLSTTFLPGLCQHSATQKLWPYIGISFAPIEISKGFSIWQDFGSSFRLLTSLIVTTCPPLLYLLIVLVYRPLLINHSHVFPWIYHLHKHTFASTYTLFSQVYSQQNQFKYIPKSCLLPPATIPQPWPLLLLLLSAGNYLSKGVGHSYGGEAKGIFVLITNW